jgi:hypothetical protein
MSNSIASPVVVATVAPANHTAPPATTALSVPAPSATDLVATALGEIAERIDSPLSKIAHNFVGDALTVARLLNHAKSGQSKPLAEMPVEGIRLAHWLIHAVDIVSPESGEVNTCPRIVLFDEAGNGYHGVSQGVYDSLIEILQHLGLGKLPEKLRVKCVVKRTGRGRTLHSLQIV